MVYSPSFIRKTVVLNGRIFEVTLFGSHSATVTFHLSRSFRTEPTIDTMAHVVSEVVGCRVKLTDLGRNEYRYTRVD